MKGHERTDGQRELVDKEVDESLDDGTEVAEMILENLEKTLPFLNRQIPCPMCSSPLFCFSMNGRSRKYICSRNHIFSIDEVWGNS